jgi:hypothetical protein
MVARPGTSARFGARRFGVHGIRVLTGFGLEARASRYERILETWPSPVPRWGRFGPSWGPVRPTLGPVAPLFGPVGPPLGPAGPLRDLVSPPMGAGPPPTGAGRSPSGDRAAQAGAISALGFPSFRGHLKKPA